MNLIARYDFEHHCEFEVETDTDPDPFDPIKVCIIALDSTANCRIVRLDNIGVEMAKQLANDLLKATRRAEAKAEANLKGITGKVIVVNNCPKCGAPLENSSHSDMMCSVCEEKKKKKKKKRRM